MFTYKLAESILTFAEPATLAYPAFRAVLAVIFSPTTPVTAHIDPVLIVFDVTRLTTLADPAFRTVLAVNVFVMKLVLAMMYLA